MRFLTPLAMLVLFLVSSAAAEPRQVKVAVNEAVPFVILDEKGRPGGFDIDLWKAIAAELGWTADGSEVTFEFVVEESFAAMLDSVKNREADFGLACATITSEREDVYDFSYPYMDSGLSLAVLSDRGKAPSLISDISGALRSSELLKVFFIVLLFILASAHVIWFAERGSEAFDDRYFPGILEGCWWAVVTMTTVGYGDKVPHRWISRAAGTVIMFVGIITFSAFTAVIASSQTIKEFTSNIQGPEDFSSRLTRAGAVRRTTGAEFLEAQSRRLAGIEQYDTIDAALKALKSEAIDCVAFDAPMLRYLARKDTAIEVTERMFELQKYGVLMPLDNKDRKAINAAILRLERNGTLSKLKRKYFSE